MDSFLKLLKPLGDDWLGITLNFLKLLGVVVSGFAAIVATATDKPNKKEKPLPKTKIGNIAREIFSKRWAIRWTVFGLAVSILSQFVETINTTNQTTEARKKEHLAQLDASNQLWLAHQSLDFIERITTRFEHLHIQATYELKPLDPDFAKLLQTVKTILDPVWKNVLSQATNSANQDQDTNVVRSIDTEGCAHLPSSPLLYFSIFRDTNIVVRLDSLEAPDWRGTVHDFDRLMRVFTYLKSPELDLELNSKKTAGEVPDFYAKIHNIGPPELHISSSHQPYKILWSFDCPKNAWTNTQRMSSLLDLDNATLRIRFVNPIPVLWFYQPRIQESGPRLPNSAHNPILPPGHIGLQTQLTNARANLPPPFVFQALPRHIGLPPQPTNTPGILPPTIMTPVSGPAMVLTPLSMTLDFDGNAITITNFTRNPKSDYFQGKLPTADQIKTNLLP
jgi:hypothetical protein